jgi:polysaccharide pyruvyl transferase WcaK-like protein
MIAMRGGVWLLRLLPFALGFLVGRVPPRVAKRLAGVDMMVLLGGSDIYDNPSVLQVLSLARLFTVLYPLWAASELGIPVVVLGHTIGPLSRPIGRRLTTRLLGLAQSVVVRESTSLALVKALGLRNAVLAPDMAFALNPRRSERVEEILSRLPLRGGEALCLVVRQHPHMGDKANNRLLDELEKVAANYLAVDASRWVVVVAQVHGPTTIEDDRPLSRKLAGRLPLDRSILVDADLSAGELSALYGSCRLMVAVRLHAAILAMVGGTPAYAISYFTAKSAGVMDDLGLGDSVGVFDKVTAGQIDQALRDLDGSPVRTRLREVRAGWRSALTSIVNSWPDPTLKSRETLEAEDAWAS